ncbi:MAG: ABC transporter substrate-binding protein [Deltaproteobacteria bacterium]|nr:ABC transporter substrate-binding protein [Deltaproteobacteria bacterium]
MKTQKRMAAAIIRGLALVLVLNLGVAAPPVFAGPPTEDVKAIIDEVMGILRNPAYQAPGQKTARLRLIEQSALRRLDYQEMAKRCLEETWNTISQAQRAEFIRMFAELLKASYADKLDDFAKSKVTYEGESQNGNAAEVRILVLRTNDKIPVKFQLLQSPQGWMIYDLIIEDVSLVNNLRTEFGKIIKSSSFAALMKCLRLKLQSNIADLKPCPPPPGPAPKTRSKGGS